MSLWTLDSGTVTLDSGVFTWDGFAPASSEKVGGDDVPRRKSPHRGFDLERWKASQPDFEATLRQAYAELTRGPMQDEAREVVAAYIQTGQHGVDWAALAR